MKIRNTVRLFIILAVVVCLSACGYNRDGAAERGNTGRDGMTESNRMGTMNNNNYDRLADERLGTSNVNMHQNTLYELSQDISDRLADLQEVDRASVLLTNQNAYIAVVLSDGINAKNINRVNEKGTTGTVNNKTYNKSNKSMSDKKAKNNNANRDNKAKNNNANRDNKRLDDTRMKRQYNEDLDITTMLKNKITREVQFIAPHVKNVYISANPDFGDRMNGFIDQLQAGHPVRGLVDEINTTMERMFPTNNAPNITPQVAP